MTHDLDERRRFLGLSLAAAGVAMTGPTRAAQPSAGGAKAATAARKPVYLVVYRPGPGWIAGKSLNEQALKPHFNYMLELYDKGVLRFAGPFGDDNGGALAFEASDDTEASAVLAADPAVTSKIFAYELRRWKLVAWEKYTKPTA